MDDQPGGSQFEHFSLFFNSKLPIVQTSLKLLLPILEIKPSCQNQNIQQTILNNPSAFSVLVALNQQITRGCNITIYLSWTFGACEYQVSCRNMGKFPRNMNGVFELTRVTRRNSPGEHLQPLSPWDPPLKGGGYPKFSGHAPAAVAEGVLKQKNRDTPRNCGKNGVLIFCEGGEPKFSGHTPAAVSEGVPTRKIGTHPELRENWCPDFFGGGGAWDPFCEGSPGFPQLNRLKV